MFQLKNLTQVLDRFNVSYSIVSYLKVLYVP
jgi:hypothetical protein